MRGFAFTGRSDAGKSTLIAALTARLCARGLRVSTVKHAHQGFDLDRPGKDSYRFREAGASQVLLASGQRWALLAETAPERPARLAELLGRLDPCDFVLVEGFRGQDVLPAMFVHRSAPDRPAFQQADEGSIAIATNDASQIPAGTCLPVFALDALDEIEGFVLAQARPARKEPS